MRPLTILAAQKLASLLGSSEALQTYLHTLANANGVQIPALNSGHIFLTSAAASLGDLNMQLSYPRICLYSTLVKNTQVEKFRSLSGTISVVAEIWASANLIGDADMWIHYYVEAVTSILRKNIGDWGDGLFFSGAYEVHLDPPKSGGLGYVELAKLICNLNVSRN